VSHFTRIRTKMVKREYLIGALRDLGYAYTEGDEEVLGFDGRRTRVEIRVTTRSPGYDIGFCRRGEAYECVADWWGINDVSQEKFLQKVAQRYAYQATQSELTKQGFAVVREQVSEDGRIHLVLRRAL